MQVSLQTGSPLQASKPPEDSDVDVVESVELDEPHIGSEGSFVQVSLQTGSACIKPSGGCCGSCFANILIGVAFAGLGVIGVTVRVISAVWKCH